MKQPVIRWTCYFAALFAAGPLAGSLVAAIRSPDGAPDASALTGSAPARDLALCLGAFGIAGVMGLAAAWLTNTRAAMTTAGLTLVWAAYRSGNVENILRESGSAAPLWRLAAEGVIFGILAALVMVGIHAVSRREHHESPALDKPGFGKTLAASLKGPGVLVAIPAAVIAGGAAAWIVANTALRGQTIGAALVAGLAGAAIARLVDARVPASVLLVPAAILAIAGPAAAAVALGGDIVSTVNRGGLFPVARIMPLDWIAGAFLGVPIGLAWTASVVDKRA